jgi:hypothetical protein
VEAISATRRNNTGIAPSFIVMKAEASDNAEKRRRNHWDVFIIWANDEAWHPLPGAPLRFRLRFVTTLRL